MTEQSRFGFPRSPLLVLAFGLTGLILICGIYLGSGFLEGNTDRYGRVSIPGAEAIFLETGEVDVFYAQVSEDEALPSLDDLRRLKIDVEGPEGGRLEIRPRGRQTFTSPSGTAALIGSLEVRADGSYEVAVARGGAELGEGPEVTLGDSPFDVVADRAKNLFDWLVGPLGALLLAAFALVIVVVRPRGGSEIESPEPPPGESRYIG